MARAASKDIVILGSRRKAKLEAITRRASAPQALARRARIVLLVHAGWPNARIAAELGCAEGTVRTWRRRFIRGGIPALADRPRSGRPEVYGPSVRLALVAAATSVPPDDRPEWTHALIAAELAGTGISASQAGRILADLELRPHKVRGWLRRADDAQFWAQAAALCDAYLRPPPDTIVICIDEKTGIQAKYRKYPGRLPAPGRPARREFEYVRNGTVSVIAALHVATGQVVTEPVTRNDSAAFTGFLHRLTQCIDPRLNIRIVMDNGSSHTSRATRAWIAARPGSPSPTPRSTHPGWTWPNYGFPCSPGACCAAANSPPAPTSSTRSPASRSATTRPPDPGPGPTTPATTTPGTAPATAHRTRLPPPDLPSPKLCRRPPDRSDRIQPTPSRISAALH